MAIHLVVHIARVNGRRLVTEVTAVRGYDQQGDGFCLESLLPGRHAAEEGIAR